MRKVLTVVAVALLLVVIVLGVGTWLGEQPGQPGMPGKPKTTSPTAQQPAHCSDVELISVPGTWESSPSDDPMNPTFNPKSLMLRITKPLQDKYGEDRLKVWTVPYTAQFKNINAMHEMTYDASRTEGYNKIVAEMQATNKECPLTNFVLIGFSQGAVMLGDLASEIGQGSGPVPADRVLGVTLLADGRREPGVGNHVGTKVRGIGAEIALQPVSALVQAVTPGASMRGSRPGGFGELDDRTNEICAPNDSICDAPRDIGNALQRANELIQANGVHARYATNPKVVNGTTATKWTFGWAVATIDGAPDY